MKKVLKSFPNLIDDPHLKKKLPYIGKYLGDGVEGTVFQYGKNKVIKLVTENTISFNYFKQVVKTTNNIKLFQKVFEYRKSKANSIQYWYIAEKLQPISIVYEELINEIHDHGYYTGNVKNKSFKSFNTNYAKLPVRYRDLHAGNVMKNKHGVWKLIDLEGVRL